MNERQRIAPENCITKRPRPADKSVKSAWRVLELLEFIDDVQRPTTVMEVSQSLGYPQSSTSALLRSLVTAGYLIYDRYTRKYVTSSRVALLGSWVNAEFFGAGRIISLMKELSEQTGDAIILACRNGLQMNYIHVIQSTDPSRHHLTRGTVRPLARSGSGYAVLAQLPDFQVQRLVMQFNAEAEPGTPIVVARDLLAVLREVRQRHYAFTTDLNTKGGALIAATLPQLPDQPLLVVGIGGLTAQMRPIEDSLSKLLIGTIARHFGQAPTDAALPRGAKVSAEQAA